jgi:hypothetical protein
MGQQHGKQVLFSQVKIDDAFWSPRIAINRQVTLAHEYEMCRTTGRLDAFKLDWKPGMEPVPHIFWDSGRRQMGGSRKLFPGRASGPGFGTKT